MARVWVAMSGGVDSSVAAALLVESGHEVTGVTMQLLPSGDEEGECCFGSATRDARQVCDDLGIAHHTLDFRDSFERHVIGPFADAYAQGRTPNPCIACNDQLKFSDLMAGVIAQGAEFLATGHYARIVRDATGSTWLARGTDPDKDQSYFLYRLTRIQMDRILFPVGGLGKQEVRARAARFGLRTAERSESQDTCFASSGGYAPIVAARRPRALVPGEFVTQTGDVIGSHRGLAHYTIGQRRGLDIGGPDGPWFVVSMDPASNRIVVGHRDSVSARTIIAAQPVWSGAASEVCTAQVRYRMTPAAATARYAGDSLTVNFGDDVGAAAPGQSVVCYRGDRVLGGGVIECAS